MCHFCIRSHNWWPAAIQVRTKHSRLTSVPLQDPEPYLVGVFCVQTKLCSSGFSASHCFWQMNSCTESPRWVSTAEGQTQTDTKTIVQARWVTEKYPSWSWVRCHLLRGTECVPLETFHHHSHGEILRVVFLIGFDTFLIGFPLFFCKLSRLE